MTAQDVLIRQMERQEKALIHVARMIPEDKIEWAPEGLRSTLDQLQEVSTAVQAFQDSYAAGRMEPSPEMMSAWMVLREPIKTVDDAEAALRIGTQWLIDYVRSLPDSALSGPVTVPWDPSFTRMDMITFHYWNMSYHEGAITQLLMTLGIPRYGN
jgi:hypothetical protein